MSPRTVAPQENPEALLRSLIATYEPEEQRLIRAVRSAIRKRLPAANEVVYDYSGSLVVSYTPTEHGKDGILTTAMKGDGLRLYFGGGPRLPDPKKVLLGSGGTRYILIDSARRLADPEVKALISAAIAASKTPLSSKATGRLIDRATSQQARRKKGSR